MKHRTGEHTINEEGFKPDPVITGIIVPVVKGIERIDQISNRYADVPINSVISKSDEYVSVHNILFIVILTPSRTFFCTTSYNYPVMFCIVLFTVSISRLHLLEMVSLFICCSIPLYTH